MPWGALAYLARDLLSIFFLSVLFAIFLTELAGVFARYLPIPYKPTVGIIVTVLLGLVSLWSWLIGRFATMTLTGTSVGIGLWFLGVPMPITLGVVTGLLITFVPNIGGMLALSLAVFMALPSGLSTVTWVVGLYIAFQLVESYIITPLIQQYQVDIPPALLIGTQAPFGFLLGFLGAMVASPLLVAFLVLHDEVYQKHIHRWQKSS